LVKRFSQFGQITISYNHISVEVPTVERAFVVFYFFSIAIAGAIPLIYSTLVCLTFLSAWHEW
jgi:hypothetical protein